MGKNVFGLLIAIDEYAIAPLRGCVNDSQDVQAVLQHLVPADNLHLRVLHNKEATRENIKAAFLEHLTQAGENDSVFVHYSGHGSRELSDSMFWHLNPDRHNEVMITIDSLIPGIGLRNPLADKELRWLIAQVAKKNPHICVMLDCCHSGGGTRDLSTYPTNQVITNRFTAQRTQMRGFHDYVFGHDEALLESFAQNGRFHLPSGKHILMAGCRYTQTSKELVVGGKQHGIFTFSTLDILKLYNGQITYRDLVAQAGARVMNIVREQVPQLEAVKDDKQIYQPFLGGAALSKTKYYNVFSNKKNQWYVDAGQTSGIFSSESEPAVFKIYETHIDIAEMPDHYEWRRSATDISPSQAILTEELPLAERYKAVVETMSAPQTKVRIEVEESSPKLFEGVELAKEALQKSLYLKLVDECSDADFRIVAYQHENCNKYRICKPTDERPLVKQVEEFTEDSVQDLLVHMEEIAKWQTTFQLSNPQTKLPLSAIDLEISALDEKGNVKAVELTSGEIKSTYKEDGEERISPAYRVKMTNNSTKNLYYAAYILGSDFSCTDDVLPTRMLKAGESLCLWEDEEVIFPFEAFVSESLLNLGVTEEANTLKIIASTEQFNSSDLNQNGLEMPESMRPLRKSVPAKKDWISHQITFTAVKELNTYQSENLLESSGITVKFPKKTKAKIGLGSASQQNSRSVSAAPWVNTDELFAFVSSRGTAPQLNVLEISNIQDLNSITADNRIEVNLPYVLAENESLIPIASDGELLYPLGFANGTKNGTKVVIERLIGEEAGISERGLLNTVKIVFQKVVGKKLGFGYEYPYLAAVDATAESHYNTNKIQINEQVATANSVLVIVHGLVGETANMLRINEEANGSNSLYTIAKKQYDVVLAFDYDSYNTSLKETALAFKNRLIEIGLAAGHGKKVHVLAHSTGGLMARWFVEREGGNEMIEELLMLGTPNAGSPWPKIKDWTVFAATLALSKLTVVGWPLAALNFLIDKAKIVEGLDKVTDDLKIDSEFMEMLNNSNDPKIPYTIFAGNTSLIKDKKDDSKQQGMIKKICSKLKINSESTRKIVDLLFREKNDIFSSQTSMNNINLSRKPLPIAHEVACDHFSYFNTAESLAILEEKLG
ncbi:MAG: caspase family protein [Chitinophagales bacterium]